MGLQSAECSGHGISAEFLPHVFDTFRQEDPAKSRRHGGLGLGLAIARHLTEAHGGSLKAESDGREGARFTVTLPVFTGLAIETAHLTAVRDHASPT